MSPIVSLIRAIVLTAVGLLASLFLSIPVYAAAELSLIVPGDNPAADQAGVFNVQGDEYPPMPVETPTPPAVEPATVPVVTDPDLIAPEIDEVIVVPAPPKPVTEPQTPEPQQPGGFRVYLPMTVQMASLAAQ